MNMNWRSGTLSLLCLAACLALSLAACKKDTTEEIAFSPRLPDEAGLKQALADDQASIQGFEPKDQSARLVEYFKKLNRVMLDHGRTQLEAESAMQNLRLAAKRSLEEYGHADMRRLGNYLLEQFMTRLDALIEAASKTPGAITPLLAGAPPPAGTLKAFKDFAELGGDFLVLAFANELVLKKDDKLELAPESRFFIRLAFKVRWANIFPEVTRPFDFLLSDFEKRWYETWVAERSKTASKQRRLQAARRLKVLEPDYDHLRAMGVICYQAKDYPAAVAAFEAALKAKPDDKILKSFLDQAKQKAR